MTCNEAHMVVHQHKLNLWSSVQLEWSQILWPLDFPSLGLNPACSNGLCWSSWPSSGWRLVWPRVSLNLHPWHPFQKTLRRLPRGRRYSRVAFSSAKVKSPKRSDAEWSLCVQAKSHKKVLGRKSAAVAPAKKWMPISHSRTCGWNMLKSCEYWRYSMPHLLLQLLSR